MSTAWKVLRAHTAYLRDFLVLKHGSINIERSPPSSEGKLINGTVIVDTASDSPGFSLTMKFQGGETFLNYDFHCGLVVAPQAKQGQVWKRLGGIVLKTKGHFWAR